MRLMVAMGKLFIKLVNLRSLKHTVLKFPFNLCWRSLRCALTLGRSAPQFGAAANPAGCSVGGFQYRLAVLQMINAKRDMHIQDLEMSVNIHLHKLRLVLEKNYKM